MGEAKGNWVTEKRKALVEMVISLMEQDGFFFNKAEWNRGAFSPQNPFSHAVYKGGNRLRLMLAAYMNSYDDPRWATFKQISDAGLKVKKGAKGVTCEKWSFEKETKVVDENGEVVHGPDGKAVKETVELERPVCRSFTLFHASQIEGMPELTVGAEWSQGTFSMLADNLIEASECPVYERNQSRAYYSTTKDEIVLPPRGIFKDEPSFVKTLIHEEVHSTGAPSRLNREFGAVFGEEKYAREELVAELGALFVEADLGVQLKAEHYEDHSDYLKSWVGALKKDPNVLFQVAAEAEKAADRIVERYRIRYPEQIKDTSLEPVSQKKEITNEQQKKGKKVR